ncbi:MAG: hypothetical protein IKH04_02300 [Kiritimatiellae bacterium]|nr:hypothetical protein [Kiritimatiellia bacterium]
MSGKRTSSSIFRFTWPGFCKVRTPLMRRAIRNAYWGDIQSEVPLDDLFRGFARSHA